MTAGRVRVALKQRERGEGRAVPIFPELVAILQRHLEEYATALDGRIFQEQRGVSPMVSKSTYAKVWRDLASLPSALRSQLRRWRAVRTTAGMRACRRGSTPTCPPPRSAIGLGTARTCCCASTRSAWMAHRTLPGAGPRRHWATRLSLAKFAAATPCPITSTSRTTLLRPAGMATPRHDFSPRIRRGHHQTATDDQRQ